MNCVDMIINIKADSAAPDLETWEYFKAVLKHLGQNGMSSEEERIQQLGSAVVPIYLVKLCLWRAAPVTKYMDMIDEGALSLKTGKGARQTPRVRSQRRASSSNAPVGMPRKMYDEEWLAEQESKRPRYVVEELRISKEVFEFLVEATVNADMNDEDV